MTEIQTEGKTLYVNRRIYCSPVRSIFEKFGRQKEVSLVYGEPLEYENTCVLPVAEVHYFVGGGGGGGTTSENGEQDAGQGYGEGGGGHISVKPLGIYEINEDGVKFKPTVDIKFLSVVATVLTLGLTFILKKKS